MRDNKGEYYTSQCIAGNDEELMKEYNKLGLKVIRKKRLTPLDSSSARYLYAAYSMLGILVKDERD